MSLHWYHYASKGAAYTAPAPPAETLYVDAVNALTPDGYWRLGDASGNATDSSGNARTLTANGTPTYGVAGWATDGGTGITFVDANLDMFYRNTEAWMNVATNDFSLVWCQKHAAGWPTVAENIMGHDGAGNNGQWELWMRENAADTLRMNLADATSGNLNFDLQAAADVLDSGSWVHCALTVDRSALATLYVNGSSADTVDVSAAVAYDLTNARPLRLGAANQTGSDGYNGSLCEVALWTNRLLSGAEVAALYAAR